VPLWHNWLLVTLHFLAVNIFKMLVINMLGELQALAPPVLFNKR
jgi:hypothetical protein